MEVYAGYSENADYNVGRVHRRDRRDGRARQHPRHLDLGRQRRQHGGHAHRLVQRADDAERHPADRRAAAAARPSVRRPRRLGRPRSWRRTTRRPGRGPATPRSSGASRSPRTSAAPATRWSCTGPSGSRTRAGCASQFTHVIDIGPTILERRRHPAADARSTASSSSRCTAPRFADSFDRRRRARAPHPAVLRDRRQPRHVQGRLVARDEDCRASRGCSTPEALAPFAPGRLGSRRRPGRAVLPARRLHPGARPRRRAPGEGRRSSRSCSGRRPSATRCCRCSAALSTFFGIAAAAAGRRRSSTSAATSRTSRPGMIPRIYNHSYTISADLVDPRGRRRGRDRRRGRPPRRVLALRRGRQAHAHLLDDGRVRVHAGVAEEPLPDRRASPCGWSSPPTRRSRRPAAR